MVLSVWQDGRCLATVRLAPQDVPGLVGALGAVASAPPAPLAAAG